MSKIYGVSITYASNDKREANKYGEEFYPCMSEDELERIEKEKDRNALTTYLLNTLSMMDSTISAIATSIEKGLPIQVKILFTIKDAIKGSVLNMGNEELSVTEIIVLGGITIVVGIATIFLLPEAVFGTAISIIGSLIISYLTTWLLNNVYIYLRDNSVEQIWQDIKDLANDTWKRIISLIESDTRSLEERKEEITQRAIDQILSATSKDTMTKKEYEECITYLCDYSHPKQSYVSTQDSTNSKDSPIHLESKESTLCPNNVNAHRKGEIHFAFRILDKDAKTPIPNAEIQLENINLGVKALTDSRGLVSFSLPESEYLKSFRARLIYPNYYPTPISDRSIIINALRDKIQVLRFKKKLWLCFNGKSLAIMQGNDIIQEFIAFSGNALSLTEKEQLQKEKGYTHFVEYEEKGLLNNTTYYFCLDKEWQQERDRLYKII